MYECSVVGVLDSCWCLTSDEWNRADRVDKVICCRLVNHDRCTTGRHPGVLRSPRPPFSVAVTFRRVVCRRLWCLRRRPSAAASRRPPDDHSSTRPATGIRRIEDRIASPNHDDVDVPLTCASLAAAGARPVNAPRPRTTTSTTYSNRTLIAAPQQTLSRVLSTKQSTRMIFLICRQNVSVEAKGHRRRTSSCGARTARKLQRL